MFIIIVTTNNEFNSVLNRKVYTDRQEAEQAIEDCKSSDDFYEVYHEYHIVEVNY